MKKTQRAEKKFSENFPESFINNTLSLEGIVPPPPKPAFNKNHPERQKDEVWVTNADDGNDFDDIGEPSSYSQVGWKTKRKGNVAYDIDGKPLGMRWPGSFPVFAKQEEIKKVTDGEDILKRMLPD